MTVGVDFSELGYVVTFWSMGVYLAGPILRFKGLKPIFVAPSLRSQNYKKVPLEWAVVQYPAQWVARGTAGRGITWK